MKFINSKADSSLFIKREKRKIIYILVYVDYLIITGNNLGYINSFIKHLCQTFHCRDLGLLKYFIGIEIIYNSEGAILSQQKYAKDILDKFSMSNCASFINPIASKSKLSVTDGEILSDPTTYRQIIGSLQYLTLTRPDLSYAATQFSPYPRTGHLRAAKRILRYIKGTIDNGIRYFKDQQNQIQVFNDSSHQFFKNTVNAFSDADWAGSPDTTVLYWCLRIHGN